jgi:hypothetical protein
MTTGYRNKGTKVLDTTTTVQAVPFPALAPNVYGAFFAAASAQVVIDNPAASGQAITIAWLSFDETVGGPARVSYALSLSPSTIPAGSHQVLNVVLSNGVLNNPTVAVTYAANPSNPGGTSVLTVLLELFP